MIGRTPRYILLTCLSIITTLALGLFLFLHHELKLQEIIFIMVFFAIIVFQLLLIYKTAVIPVREAEADERSKLMLDTTPLICTLWDTEGNVVDCDGEALKIYGFSEK